MTTDTIASDETNTAAPEMDRGQSYLIGETIYLRGAELGDAKWATAWRAVPFPISAQLAEEQLKKSIPDDLEKWKTLLIACRRDDRRPVGSARIDERHDAASFLSLHSDPALGADGDRLQAEMLEAIVPWLSTEHNRPVVVLLTDVDCLPVTAAAERLGMQPAVRLRDGIWRDGALHDLIQYELYHPSWVTHLGDPGVGITDAGEPVLAPRSPAPRRDRSQPLPLPANALLGSERLALRPMQIDDAETIANLLRAEPDTSFGHSRYPYSAVAISDWAGTMSKEDVPKDIEFAVVLRESGELIGENGIYDIDWLARNGESGTWIYKPEYRGSGYGTEAKHLLLEYAFERLNLHMIWSWVKGRNPRSQAALRKQGYRDAGRTNWIGFGPDGFEDARMFDLLASEWRNARG
jgi:RimJ/RimL family protein N-acetyltransferase